MEPRRTRSSIIHLPLRSRVTTRMVKSTCVPSHELAKLKASKPMLVIPQPVLRIHKCLDENVRMAQIESNAYIALGIKEEPIDEEYDAEGRHYEDVNFSTLESFNTEKSFAEDNQLEETEFEGMRATRASKRRRLEGVIGNNEDDNNNRNKKNNRRKTVKGKKGEENPEFRPIVLNVRSLAPTEPSSEPSGYTNPSSFLLVQSKESVAEAIEGNNNIEKEIFTSSKNDEQNKLKENHEDVPALPENWSSSEILVINDSDSMKTLLDVIEKSVKVSSNDSTPERETVSSPVLPEDALNETENDLSLSTIVEEEELTSSSEEESETENTPKLWVLKEEERRTLTCSVCKKKCSRTSILTAHKKKHFDTNTYFCTHCNKTFSSESSYKHHIAYSGLAPFKCDQCHKSYYTEQKAEAHRAQCQGKNTERKFHCEECGRSYVMLCSLRTHIRERHSDFKPVKNLCCEICGKRFRHKKYLELHMYSHSSEKKFECDVCHRKYKSSDILRHHVRMVHKNLPRVTCDICHKEVSRVSLKAHINRHREKKEEEEKSARHLLSLSLTADGNAPSCRVCAKYFESEKLLEMHACEGQKAGTSFPCHHCSESFPSATELVGHSCKGLDNSKSRNTAKIYKCIFCNREYGCHTPWLYHVRHHTNDKPYPCPECDKSFRLKQGLKVHMRNHTGEKPFKCDQCPAAFKQKPFLLDHMNTHTGNKPYQCQKCLARFSVRSALSTHKRIHRREMKRNSELEAASSS